MQMKELNGKTKKELIDLLLLSKKELMNLRFSKVNAVITDISRIRKVKKSIARISTAMNCCLANK